MAANLMYVGIRFFRFGNIIRTFCAAKQVQIKNSRENNERFWAAARGVKTKGQKIYKIFNTNISQKPPIGDATKK